MTVITQVDFDFSDNAGIAAITGGADGDAGLYVSGGGSVPDPPSGAGTEGDYCRGYLVPAGGGGTGSGDPVYSIPWIKSSVEGGVFHGAQPTNQAYSLRAWVRVNTPNFRNCRIGFAMRMDPTVTFGSGANLGFSGYGIHLGNRGPSGGSGGMQMYGWANKPTGQVSSVPTVTTAVLGTDTWLKCRMDVLHLPAVQDTVTYYTGTGATGSEVWTQFGQNVIPVASDGYNGPSVATNRTCFFFQSGGGASNTSTTYIDRFQAIMSIVT